MKKTLLVILIAIFVTTLYGKYIYSLYESDTETVDSTVDELIYIVQQGVYSSEENAKKYSTDLNYYIIDKDNNYYKVYVGITQSKESSDKIKGIYNNMGKDIYVWEKNINNKAFIEVLKQYDALMKDKTDSKDIIPIQTQVLGKYEELVIRNE
jgi:peptidoglycan hydrolase CwlO-like protein